MTRRPFVADASLLIALERIGRLDLIPAVFSQLVIPPAVQREIGPGLVQALGLVVQAPRPPADARLLARSLGVPIIGTVGILLLAKERGAIPVLKPLIDDLIATGFRVDQRLYHQILQEAGE